MNELSKKCRDAARKYSSNGWHKKLLTEIADEAERLLIQRDQVLHLLQGGTLTEQQVIDSGIGVSVLSEQRHHEYMRTKAEKERDQLRTSLLEREAQVNGMLVALTNGRRVCDQISRLGNVNDEIRQMLILIGNSFNEQLSTTPLTSLEEHDRELVRPLVEFVRLMLNREESKLSSDSRTGNLDDIQFIRELLSRYKSKE